ncbi:MAG: DUF1934 domain-containing protein [Clostridia bacterium]|nr:DUF1934 domain-containing protein [Clostridia bacterium]
MTKRTVTIRIETKRTELAASLFEEDGTGELPFDFGPMEEEDEAELLVEGRLVTTTNEVKLLYEESELSGMEGSVTCLSFLRANPDVVTMTRSGEVRTALVFEEGQRHICVYNTPFLDFEVCIKSYRVRNSLLERGRIDLDYIVEIHGAKAERCRMTIRVESRKELFEE